MDDHDDVLEIEVDDTAFDEMQDMTSEDEYAKQEQRTKDIDRLKSMTTELLKLVHRNENALLFTEAKNSVHTLILFCNHIEDES